MAKVQEALGMIETRGLVASIEAADWIRLVLLGIKSFGISIFLVHKFLSSLESSSFDIFSSLREKITEFIKVIT